MNIGIIGSGSIVELMIQATESLNGICIKALYTRNKKSDNALSLQKKYGIPFLYDSLEEMLVNPQINTVYVASPNSLHFTHSLQALKAHKHVICEKPFTSTAKEAELLFKTAKENHLFLFEAITTIYYPNYHFVQEKLADLGTIRMALLNYSQYSSRYDLLLAGEKPNVFNPQYAGGSLQDLNIYNIHFMMGLFGTPHNTQYYPNMHPNGIDTSGILIMQYPGFTASLTGSKDTAGESFVYIQGEKGYLSVSHSANTCGSVTVHSSGQEETVNKHDNTNRLFYEFQAFEEMYGNKDYEKCYSLAQYSISVISLVEKARKQAGILFPADNQ